MVRGLDLADRKASRGRSEKSLSPPRGAGGARTTSWGLYPTNPWSTHATPTQSLRRHLFFGIGPIRSGSSEPTRSLLLKHQIWKRYEPPTAASQVVWGVELLSVKHVTAPQFKGRIRRRG